MTAPAPIDDQFLTELREFVSVAEKKLAGPAVEPAPPAAPTTPVPASTTNPVDQEPVLISHAVTTILSALVTLGWIVVPNSTIMAVGTLIAFLLSGVGAVMARAKVSPVNSTWWDVISGYVTDLVKVEIERGLPKV